MPAIRRPAHLRLEIDRAETRLLKMKERLAELRKQDARRVVRDYVFRSREGKRLKLSQAFGDKQDLIVVHNMGRSCPYCTLWGDAYNGVRSHLEARAAFLVTSPDDPKTQRKFARGRGWKFRMACVRGTTFARDMGFEPKPGRYWPGVTSFRKRKDGRIERVTSASFGPGDDFCSVFHFFDLLPDGSGDWRPGFRYP